MVRFQAKQLSQSLREVILFGLKKTRIVFRKLITPRNVEFVKILEEFCGNTLGSKSLVSLKTKIKPMSDSPQDEFYSSELVAATYKLLGLINDSLPSNKYQIGISCTNKIFRPVFHQGKYHGQVETQHIAW
jgi:hypothetical protein